MDSKTLEHRSLLLVRCLLLASYAQTFVPFLRIVLLISCCGAATGNVVNMVLVPILMFNLGYGVSGSAIATVISQ